MALTLKRNEISSALGALGELGKRPLPPRTAFKLAEFAKQLIGLKNEAEQVKNQMIWEATPEEIRARPKEFERIRFETFDRPFRDNTELWARIDQFFEGSVTLDGSTISIDDIGDRIEPQIIMPLMFLFSLGRD